MPVAGSGKRDACKSEACAIQDCLAQNDYNMSKCNDKVDKLKACCKDNLKESVHCGMVDSRTDTDSGASQKPDDQVSNLLLLCCTTPTCNTFAFSQCINLFLCQKCYSQLLIQHSHIVDVC